MNRGPSTKPYHFKRNGNRWVLLAAPGKHTSHWVPLGYAKDIVDLQRGYVAERLRMLHRRALAAMERNL